MKADFDFTEEDFDEDIEVFSIQEVKNLGAHTHYHCKSERIATLLEGRMAKEHKAEQLKLARGQFDIIYSEAYDVPLQSVYGILEESPIKKWFFLYGSYRELDYKKRWVPRNFDVHSMIKIPGPIMDHQRENPLEMDTPYDYQAGLTQAFGKKPWSSPQQSTVIYAGGSIPFVGQFDSQYLTEYEDVLHETDTTYVVFKAPLDFAKRNQTPQSFIAEIHTLYREGYNEVNSDPLVHKVNCHLQQRDLDEANLKALLGRSQTYDMDTHFTDDWDFPEAGGVVHSEKAPMDKSSVYQSLLANRQALPLFWAMAQTLSDPELKITDHKLLSWQGASMAAATLLSYTLLRGQGALLARSTQGAMAPPVPLQWQGYTVPSHDKFSLEQVRQLAESLQSGGLANVLEASSQFPEELLLYSLEVFDAVRKAQALEWRQNCPNPDYCI